MLLRSLLCKWINSKIPNVFIYDLSLNSKCVKYGSLFISFKGFNLDGRKFINEAIYKGANSVLYETFDILEHGNILYYKNIPIILFYDLKNYISSISCIFYKNPSSKLNLIGVTGTNGKTTVTYITSQMINLIGENSAILSTIGNGIIGSLNLTENTTDSALEIQKNLSLFINNKINTVIMEISSHSIVQRRIENLHFKTAIYTNISHDHLDFHKNMFNYKFVKLYFLKNKNIEKLIINTDDDYGDYIVKNNLIYNYILVSLKKEIYIENIDFRFKILNIYNKKYKSILKIKSNFGINYIYLNFIGLFNINNFLLSFINLLYLKFSFKKLLNITSKLSLPKGRMELFKSKNFCDIIVDFAHTPDAMYNILKIVNKNYKKNIWCIFGCGGNKDFFKRSIMGEIANKYSDNIILTNDNPRNEDPEKIINDIKIKINNNKLKIILDRKEAIKYALYNSYKNDVILVLGKGHENTQIFKNKIEYYSDQDVILNLIKNND